MWSTILLEIVKFTVPAFVVFLTTYFILKQVLQNEQHARMMEFKRERQQVALPLRFQAYERLSLYCERADIPNVILRVRNEAMQSSDLHMALLIALQKEFEHNVSQQVYVSPELWEIVKIAKDQTLNSVNMVAREMDENATGLDLSKALYDHLQTLPMRPLHQALLAIKKEASQYM